MTFSGVASIVGTLKNIQFCNLLKMPNKAPLTIENFDFERLRANAFESKKSGEFTYVVIPFDYDKLLRSRETLEYLNM